MPSWHIAIWITVCLIVAIGINVLGVGKGFFNPTISSLTFAIGAYGEAEFWFRWIAASDFHPFSCSYILL